MMNMFITIDTHTHTHTLSLSLSLTCLALHSCGFCICRLNQLWVEYMGVGDGNSREFQKGKLEFSFCYEYSKIAFNKLLRNLAPWKKSYDQPRQHIKKQRCYFVNKGLSIQGYGFSSGHVWNVDYKES